MQTVHATAISMFGLGVLLRGVPGSGKSSLALQLIEQPGKGLGPVAQAATLISDDQTILTVRGGQLIASAPANLAGLLEVRGFGIIPVSHDPETRIGLVVDLQSARLIERLPESELMQTTLLGLTLPCMALDASHPSAASRLRLAILAVTKGAFPA